MEVPMPSSAARLGMVLLGVAGLAGCAALPPPMPAAPPTAAAPPAADLDQVFLDRAATGTAGEVALGELARARGVAPAVREFGGRIAVEHRRVHARLLALARRLRRLPNEAPPDVGRLAALSGPAFDRQFIADQVTDQREALGLFDSEAAAGRDPRLRAFAREWLPMLRRDLGRAQALAAGAGL
jgi:putative membrane protein